MIDEEDVGEDATRDNAKVPAIWGLVTRRHLSRAHTTRRFGRTRSRRHFIALRGRQRLASVDGPRNDATPTQHNTHDMNDAAEASSSAAGASTNGRHTRDAQSQMAPTAAELAERQKKTRALFNKKRGTLLAHVIRDVDMLVFAELSAIYYME